MSNLAQLLQNLWVRAQLDAPAIVRREVVPLLHDAKEIARLLISPYLPVYRMEGQAQGGSLTVSYIGLPFARPFLESLLFVETPAVRHVGRIPFWRPGDLAGVPDSDIVVVAANKHLVHKLPGQNAVILPEYVHHVLDVTGDWQDLEEQFHKSTRRDLRLTQRHGYQFELSHDDQDFEIFYQSMYLPTMQARHADRASPMSIGTAYQHFRHGVLFFVTRDGARVCGSICYIDQDTLQYMIMGVLGGDQQWIKDGAVGALNCLRLQWANQSGYRLVNFLGTDPHLGDSLFRYKRKWGTTIVVPRHLHRRIWVRIQRVTPAVSRFLQDTPLIVLDDQQALHGLIVVDDAHDVSEATRQEWEKQYVTPGLSSLRVCSVADFATGAAAIRRADLVIPIEPAADAGRDPRHNARQPARISTPS